MHFIQLITNIFAVFRLTLLFVEEQGPFNIFEKIREYFGLYIISTDQGVEKVVEEPNGYNFFGNLLSCFWCTSLYISIIVLILDKFKIGKVILQWLSYSGIAIVIYNKMEK